MLDVDFDQQTPIEELAAASSFPDVWQHLLDAERKGELPAPATAPRASGSGERERPEIRRRHAAPSARTPEEIHDEMWKAAGCDKVQLRDAPPLMRMYLQTPAGREMGRRYSQAREDRRLGVVRGADGVALHEAIYAQAVTLAKLKVAEGKGATLQEGLRRVWAEDPGLYKRYAAARPRVCA